MRKPDFQVGEYLRRWWVIPRNRIGNVYLHKISESDGQDVHDHPWWNLSIICRGRYREHYHDGKWKDRRPGSIVLRHPNVLHRLEVLDGPVWTLFLTGPLAREWGFMTPDGWVHYESYPNATNRAGRGAVKFPEGTIIKCPKCEAHLARAKIDILRSGLIASNEWQAIDAPARWPLHSLFGICPLCHASYSRVAGDGIREVFTPQGWRR